MNRKIIISVATGTALGMAILAVTNVAQASFNMNDMMNPFEWFDDDDDDDHYRYGRGYGGYGPYGGGPYGSGGYPGYGGQGQPTTIIINRSSGAEQAAPPPRLPE